jgi:hypothetical protein
MELPAAHVHAQVLDSESNGIAMLKHDKEVSNNAFFF